MLPWKLLGENGMRGIFVMFTHRPSHGEFIINCLMEKNLPASFSPVLSVVVCKSDLIVWKTLASFTSVSILAACSWFSRIVCCESLKYNAFLISNFSAISEALFNCHVYLVMHVNETSALSCRCSLEASGSSVQVTLMTIRIILREKDELSTTDEQISQLCANSISRYVENSIYLALGYK